MELDSHATRGRDPRQELIVIDKEGYYLSFLRTATE
jgi:hypothetical protein